MGTKNGPGDVEFAADVVARRLKAVRVDRGLSVRDLAAELERLGHRLLASGISKIENRERQVGVNDLIALAAALGVTPLALLVDLHAAHVNLTPDLQMLPYELLTWGVGRRELGIRLDLATGEYRPPYLAWGDMQSEAGLVESIDRLWAEVQNWHRSARPEPFGASSATARAAAAQQLAEGVRGLRSLLTLAGEKKVVVAPEIVEYVKSHRADSSGEATDGRR